MAIIEINNLTKDYGFADKNNRTEAEVRRGVFNVSLSLNKGEIFGLCGTNGSGKTTVIRHIMGFLKADSGSISVLNMDAWGHSSEIKKHIGYIPGEIAFPPIKTGVEFLNIQAEYLGSENKDYANYLINKLQLDPTANLKRMSKGMKQKTAIVAALLGDPDILIMDEPTTGLDPLMRQAFVDIILEEKRKGKTIFMSSHIFEEIEDTCDRVALIKNGEVIDIAQMDSIHHSNKKTFKIEFKTKSEFEKFYQSGNYKVNAFKTEYNQVTIDIEDKDINKLCADLENRKVKFISEIKYNLENYFDQKFKGETIND